jgi:hypothetical protein
MDIKLPSSLGQQISSTFFFLSRPGKFEFINNVNVVHHTEHQSFINCVVVCINYEWPTEMKSFNYENRVERVFAKNQSAYATSGQHILI